MMRVFLVVFSVIFSPINGVLAQSQDEAVWVQIEARPTFDAALDRVDSYAQTLPDVNGFTLPGGWYAIALGPYAPEDAEEALRRYRLQGLIPNDSYIALTSTYREQYYPPGVNILGNGTLAGLSAPRIEAAPQPQPTAPERRLIETETRAQAIRGEQRLTREEKRVLQAALQWAGFYNATIDGAFGRGTRNAMAGWQDFAGFEPTGVLTTLQRAVLIEQYTAVLEGLNMGSVRDTDAGIAVNMPRDALSFSRYDAPFAQYEPTTELSARVLLISQAGDRTTLASLYEVMQTLELVPLKGPRQLTRTRFTLVGRNDKIVSETEAELVDGEIKGFTLVWPAGDEDRRTRVLAEMRASFERLEGVLDPATGSVFEDSLDLVAGLEVRKPIFSRSGFFVNAQGAVVTTADAVQSCTRITLDEAYDATLAGVDADRGVAVLTPKQSLAPPSVARFSPLPPRLQSEIALAGYSFEGQLTAPTMTFGTLDDLRGLRGEPELRRLSLNALPGDVGGPVMDTSGNVFGMLLPLPVGSRQLPDAVRFALTGEAISETLEQAGIIASTAERSASLDPVEIASLGTGMTVLVSCWQ
ncbi:MAG: serine protease [Pseudomonadota bacterium]